VVYFFSFWYFVRRKIWQPCLRVVEEALEEAVELRVVLVHGQGGVFILEVAVPEDSFYNMSSSLEVKFDNKGRNLTTW
jgi:hypothetical protein